MITDLYDGKISFDFVDKITRWRLVIAIDLFLDLFLGSFLVMMQIMNFSLFPYLIITQHCIAKKGTEDFKLSALKREPYALHSS